MAKQNILFICVHNSARSQMAEAFLNQICGDRFAAESAGLEPGPINPLVVEVMQEVGVDFSEKKSPLKPGGMNRGTNIFDFLEENGISYHVSAPEATEERNLEAATGHRIRELLQHGPAELFIHAHP